MVWDFWEKISIWKSGRSFKVTLRGKPFPEDTQLKLKVYKTFIWCPGQVKILRIIIEMFKGQFFSLLVRKWFVLLAVSALRKNCTIVSSTESVLNHSTPRKLQSFWVLYLDTWISTRNYHFSTYETKEVFFRNFQCCSYSLYFLFYTMVVTFIFTFHQPCFSY